MILLAGYVEEITFVDNKLWYVLQSKPKKENQVYKQLCAKSIETYYPILTIKPVNPRASKIRPFFPRYLFIHVDLHQVEISALRWLPGSIGLVEFGDTLANVPDRFISELKKRLYYIQEAGGLVFDGLEKGDSVRITRGPLEGYDAIFDMRLSGTERVQLLLSMAGRSVTVDVEAGFIKKLNSKR